MTDRDAELWLDDVTRAVAAVAGEDWFPESFAGPPVVALFGPYSAGKSSLLKRLLVEAGTRLPDWLTISARPETFEPNAVDSAGLRYLDAPGTAAGREHHAAHADDAVLRADAIMVVLPPHLVMGGDEVRDVITGARFNTERPLPWPPGALLVVVGKSDSIGADPVDDPDEFAERRDRKSAEATALLRGWLGADRDTPAVHVVSADPFGSVGARLEVGPEDYATGQGWDGISALRAELDQIGLRAGELRTAARIRRACHVTSGVAAEAVAEQVTLAEVAAEARRHNSHLASLEAQLDMIAEAASVALRSAIHDELRSAADTPAQRAGQTVQHEVQSRLDFLVSAWWGTWSQRLGELARSAELHFVAQESRPAATAFRALLTDLLDGSPERPADRSTIGTSLNNLVASMREVVRLGYQRHLGRDLESARHEVTYASHLDSYQQAAYFLQPDSFHSAAELEHARHALFNEQLLEGALPALLEIGTIGWLEVHERSLHRKEAKRRQQLRAQIDELAGKMSEQVMSGAPGGPAGQLSWNATVDDLRERLRAGRIDEALTATLTERADQLAGCVETLRELLRSPGL